MAPRRFSTESDLSSSSDSDLEHDLERGMTGAAPPPASSRPGKSWTMRSLPAGGSAASDTRQQANPEPLVRPSRKVTADATRGSYAPIGGGPPSRQFSRRVTPPRAAEEEEELEEDAPEEDEDEQQQPQVAASTGKRRSRAVWAWAGGAIVVVAIVAIVLLIWLAHSGSSSSHSAATTGAEDAASTSPSSGSVASTSAANPNSTSITSLASSSLDEATGSIATSGFESISATVTATDGTATSTQIGVFAAPTDVGMSSTTAGVSIAITTALKSSSVSIQPIGTFQPVDSAGVVEATSATTDGASATPSAATRHASPTAPATLPSATATQTESSTKWVGKATWFNSDQHLSSCQTVFDNSAAVVALSSDLYGPNGTVSPFCGAELHIWNQYTNKTTSATVGDVCSRCSGPTDIDLTSSTFEKLDALDVGELEVQWWFGNASMDSLLPVDLSAYESNATSTAVYSTTAIFYSETDWTGACQTEIKDDSMIIGLPLCLYRDPSTNSTLCGQSVVVSNTASGVTLNVTVGDASNRTDYSTFPKAAYLALGGDLDTGELAVSFWFADSAIAPSTSTAS
ncbi:hypothetical protein JCM5296_005287 [Sporobolomyces johnsonii]